MTFLLIATGRYKDFVPQCTASIKKYLPKAEIILFGDGEADYTIAHQPFPYVTLYRFHYFLQAKETLPESTHFYFMDIDSRFVRKPRIEGDLVGVRHCAYILRDDLPNETNKNSVFFNYKFNKYYGGGFFGGKSEEFWKLCEWCKAGIDKDLGNKIIPRHNDETAMNAYFSIHPPTLELSPEYHYPENDEYFINNCWGEKKLFTPTILLLNKFAKESEKQYRLST